MRVLSGAELAAEPAGTIYFEVDASQHVGEFPGYAEGMYVRAAGAELGPGCFWQTELSPQPLSVQEPDGQRRLRLRAELVTLRVFEPEERFYVLDRPELEALQAVLGRALKL